MTRNRKILIALAVVALLGWIAYANLGMTRTATLSVSAEKVELRDLEATVSASGKVQPKRSVNISAETMGKVVNVQVNEGDLVTKGDLLLQIDPKNLETQVQNREASLASAKSTLDQTKASIENAKIALREAEENLKRQEQMWKNGLLSRETFERAQNDVTRQRTNLLVSEQSKTTQEQRIKQEEANLESARYDLNKVRVVSPISGIVTRRNIEEGETAVVGTMNNAGTVLLTIADLSIIETEIEVDETDIPDIHVGQPAKITIDAIKDREFPGRVTEVGNSPIQAAGSTAGRATNFKVVVTIDGTVPAVRPGFTCTAVITTATRQKTLGVPIQAMTVRELIVDAAGNVVKPEKTPAPAGSATPSATSSGTPPAKTASASTGLKEGQSRKEIEGVFLITDGKAAFVPVKVGIAGEKYFEVLSGLKEGDEVITGPPTVARTLKDGDAVKVTASPAAASPTPAR